MRCLGDLSTVLPLALILALASTAGCVTASDSDDDVVGDDTAGDTSTDTDAGTDSADTSTDAADTSSTDAADTSTDAAETTTGDACMAFEGITPQAILAASSAGEAATAPIVPDGQTVYEITLPEGAAGFVELQIPDWETTQMFFTVETIDYTVSVVDNSQVAQPRMPDPSCPDSGVTQQDIFFPHWTPALIEFAATGPRVVPLMIVQK